MGLKPLRALVIGGDGFIGKTLVSALKESGHKVKATTRRLNDPGGIFLDLAEPVQRLPTWCGAPCNAVFLVAAMQTFQLCEGNPLAWRVNVDAQIEIASRVRNSGGFVVFVSSDAVEWCGGTAYARHKAQVECVIHALGGAIVRPSRVKPDRAADLCALMIDVAAQRKAGVHRWS